MSPGQTINLMRRIKITANELSVSINDYTSDVGHKISVGQFLKDIRRSALNMTECIEALYAEETKLKE